MFTASCGYDKTTKHMNDQMRLAKRFREVILDGTWIANTNFRHQLETLDWRIANGTLANLNTIAALAQHVHYYIAGVNAVFQGGDLTISDKHSFSFPPIESQAQWEAFLDRLWKDAETFAVEVERMPMEQLDTYFVEEKYGTYLQNIESMIEHCYYHLGQVVLIRKALVAGLS